MAAYAAFLSSFAPLSARRPLFSSAIIWSPSFLLTPQKCLIPSYTSHATLLTPSKSKSNDIESSPADNLDLQKQKWAWLPDECPDNLIPMSLDDAAWEAEEEIAAGYEAMYGPAYSGISVLGNDVNVMDKNLKKRTSFGIIKREKIKDEYEERVVEVRRVTKVVKGGKQMNFRVVIIVGDKKGKVGVGVAKAKEVVAAVQKSALDARREIINLPMTKYLTFPHRSDGKFGAAKVMLRPACPGSGVIAGGAVRAVLEMAGVQNALGKQLGSDNILNNARATIVAVLKMRQFSEVAQERGIPMEELWK